MATDTDCATDLQDEIDALQASVTKQGAAVRTLKKDGKSAEDIAAAVEKLQEIKIKLAEKQAIATSSTKAFARKAFDDLLLRKMFVVRSFEIHGGVKGLFDLGPPACSLKVRTSK